MFSSYSRTFLLSPFKWFAHHVLKCIIVLFFLCEELFENPVEKIVKLTSNGKQNKDKNKNSNNSSNTKKKELEIDKRTKETEVIQLIPEFNKSISVSAKKKKTTSKMIEFRPIKQPIPPPNIWFNNNAFSGIRCLNVNQIISRTHFLIHFLDCSKTCTKSCAYFL